MDNTRKVRYVRILILSLAFFLFSLSLLLFLISNHKSRRLFIFPSVDEGKYVVEYRYLPNNPVQGDLNLFLDELLLGSGVERTKLLFARGTKINSCFVRKGTLYLDLSADLLQTGSGVINIEEGIKLLKKNVHKNFFGIWNIEIFVDGKYAYK